MLAYVGQTAEKVGPLDLAEVISETLSLLGSSLPQNVFLKTDIPIQGPIILADLMHIKQVLTNLVLNASEAIGDRSGDVSVAIYETSEAQVLRTRFFPPDWESKVKSYVCLSVSDTGCGLDAETQEKIFDPFFSTKFTGRGLGLSVVVGLVRAYGGAISVESQIGWGSTFRVFFPLPEADKLPSRDGESLISDSDNNCMTMSVSQ
jgi:signal transduction histidine kinase